MAKIGVDMLTTDFGVELGVDMLVADFGVRGGHPDLAEFGARDGY